MDPKFKTSFIPKQEIRTMGTRPPSGFRFSILSIIAMVALVASVVLSVSVFLYQKSLVKSINNMNAELVAARSNFEPNFINEMIKLDKRLEMVKSLINNHQAVTIFFDLLEQKTLQSLRFTSFEYSSNAGGALAVTLKGEASNFSSVALQSDVFDAEPKLENPIFSGLGLDDGGNVNFEFKSNLKKSDFLYKQTLEKTKEIKTDNLDI